MRGGWVAESFCSPDTDLTTPDALATRDETPPNCTSRTVSVSDVLEGEENGFVYVN